ncbi:MAG: asparagine synthase-related protein [Rhodospirillales bacterium]
MCAATFPVGLFLSGGIDSTTLLACLARLKRRPTAFTAGFDVRGAADERREAARLAKSVGVDHVTVAVTEAETFRHLPAIAACMDDPRGPTTPSSPAWFSRPPRTRGCQGRARREGGDEFFAGYGRYRSAARPWWRGGRRMRERGTFSASTCSGTTCPTGATTGPRSKVRHSPAIAACRRPRPPTSPNGCRTICC